ncbi:MAG: NADH-quinone oxidoreductase subunit [Bacteroidetes bacterium]|jgi:NADH-quinone oxidoreductase subunit C|nr:NADH-quinone oxidoreductase subunit [Bacteroidota bacterium]
MELLEIVSAKLNERFPDEIESAALLYDYPVFTVKKDSMHDVLKFLKEDEELNFHFLTTLCGVQTPDEKQLGVVYHLHNMPKNYRIRLKTFFDINKPEIPTVTDLYPTANWMERETYDFFGVRFKGHPNLKRILNVDEMDIFPMRKEYPLEDQARTDKKDDMFGR